MGKSTLLVNLFIEIIRQLNGEAFNDFHKHPTPLHILCRRSGTTQYGMTLPSECVSLSPCRFDDIFILVVVVEAWTCASPK
jgi:hypothetical protein